ncbi:hypothetical protein JCM5350_001549 [Sporobolomyces pararoseus]
MPIPPLPNELVDQILSYRCLSKYDLLQACLVSKSWLEPSRKSLFHSVFFVLRKTDPDTSTLSSPRTTYRLSSWSLLLFSTLTQKPELAALVKRVHLSLITYDYGIPSSLFTTPADLLSSLLLLLPNSYSFSFGTDEWFAGDAYSSFLPHLRQIRKIKIWACKEDRWLKIVAQLPNLRSLDVWFSREANPLTFLGRLKSRLEHLGIRSKDPQHLKVLTLGSELSLRSLEVQENLLHALDLSRFPNLSQLSIRPRYRHDPSPLRDNIPFLVQLAASTSLVKIDVPASLIRVTDENNGAFHNYLPSSCRRLDIGYPWTVNEIVSITAKDRGPRISEIGLPNLSKILNTCADRLRRAGALAVAAEAGVEIVWLE